MSEIQNLLFKLLRVLKLGTSNDQRSWTVEPIYCHFVALSMKKQCPLRRPEDGIKYYQGILHGHAEHR